MPHIIRTQATQRSLPGKKESIKAMREMGFGSDEHDHDCGLQLVSSKVMHSFQSSEGQFFKGPYCF